MGAATSPRSGCRPGIAPVICDAQDDDGPLRGAATAEGPWPLEGRRARSADNRSARVSEGAARHLRESGCRLPSTALWFGAPFRSNYCKALYYIAIFGVA